MSAFAIEKNVPMPEFPRCGPPKGTTIYPFASLAEVGDSFFRPAQNQRPITVKRAVRSAYQAIKKYRETHPDFYARCFEAEKDGVKGVRVWRVVKKEDKK